MSTKNDNDQNSTGKTHQAASDEELAMGKRLADVDARINKMSPQAEKTLQSVAPIGTKRQSVGRAMRLGTDLVAGVAVGGLIGFWLDRWLGTNPVCFILFFLLGTAAGFLNVFRTAKEMQKEQAELVEQGRLDLGHDLNDDDDQSA